MAFHTHQTASVVYGVAHTYQRLGKTLLQGRAARCEAVLLPKSDNYAVAVALNLC